MTVSSTDSRKTYAGNGSTTSFATSPVVFFDSSDLVVYVTDDDAGTSETLTENTHYTVTGGDGAVGTISLAGGTSPYGAPATDFTLVIDRQIPETQGADLVNNDVNDAEVQETALDRLTLICQQLATKVGRALHIGPDNVTVTGTELPLASAGSAIGWNAAGTALINIVLSTGTTLANLAASTGAALVGFIQALTGAVLRTVQEKSADVISIKDFGAVGDGVTDDTLAIQAAIDAVTGPVRLYVPDGDYLLGTFTNYVFPNGGGDSLYYAIKIAKSDIAFYGPGRFVSEYDATNERTQFLCVGTSTNWSGTFPYADTTFIEGVNFEGGLSFEETGYTGDPMLSGNAEPRTKGVYYRFAKNSSVMGCRFVGFFREAIMFKSFTINLQGSHNYFYNCQSSVNSNGGGNHHVSAIDNQIEMCYDGLEASGQNVTLAGNQIYNCKFGIIETGLGTIANANHLYVNNHIRTTDYGILIKADLKNSIIKNNTIQDSEYYGIGLIPENSLTSAEDKSDGIIVDGNVILDCNLSETLSAMGGAIVLLSLNTVVSNNIINSPNSYYGVIEKAACAGIQYRDNAFVDTYNGDFSIETFGTTEVYTTAAFVDSAYANLLNGGSAITNWTKTNVTVATDTVLMTGSGLYLDKCTLTADNGSVSKATDTLVVGQKYIVFGILKSDEDIRVTIAGTNTYLNGDNSVGRWFEKEFTAGSANETVVITTNPATSGTIFFLNHVCVIPKTSGKRIFSLSGYSGTAKDVIEAVLAEKGFINNIESTNESVPVVIKGVEIPTQSWEFKDKHLTLGTYRIWVDATGDLRIKDGAPANDTDGTVVGAQT